MASLMAGTATTARILRKSDPRPMAIWVGSAMGSRGPRGVRGPGGRPAGSPTARPGRRGRRQRVGRSTGGVRVLGGRLEAGLGEQLGQLVGDDDRRVATAGTAHGDRQIGLAFLDERRKE